MTTKTQFLPYGHRYQDSTTGLREALTDIQTGINQRATQRVAEADQKIRQDEADRLTGQRAFLSTYTPTLTTDHLTNEGFERFTALLGHADESGVTNQQRLDAMPEAERNRAMQGLLRETADAGRVARTVREDAFRSGLFDTETAEKLAKAVGSGYRDFAVESLADHNQRAEDATNRASMFSNLGTGYSRLRGGSGSKTGESETGSWGLSAFNGELNKNGVRTGQGFPDIKGNNRHNSLTVRYKDMDLNDQEVGVLENRGMVTYQPNSYSKGVIQNLINAATDDESLGLLDNPVVKNRVKGAIELYNRKLNETMDFDGAVAAPPPEIIEQLLSKGVLKSLMGDENTVVGGITKSKGEAELAVAIEKAHKTYLEGLQKQQRALIERLASRGFDFGGTPFEAENLDRYGIGPELTVSQARQARGLAGSHDAYLTAGMQQPVTQQSVSNTRGMRNNNPGNIERTGGFQGQVGDDGRFAQFATPELGYRAIAVNLGTYNAEHGIDTVSGIIGRWAPSSEQNRDGTAANNTAQYIDFISKELGVGANDKLDMRDPQVLVALATSIAKFENDGSVHDPAIVQAGVEMALGLRPTDNTTAGGQMLSGTMSPQQVQSVTEPLRAIMAQYPQAYTPKSFTYDRVDDAFRRGGFAVPRDQRTGQRTEGSTQPVSAGLAWSSATPYADPPRDPIEHGPAVNVADDRAYPVDADGRNMAPSVPVDWEGRNNWKAAHQTHLQNMLDSMEGSQDPRTMLLREYIVQGLATGNREAEMLIDRELTAIKNKETEEAFKASGSFYMMPPLVMPPELEELPALEDLDQEFLRGRIALMSTEPLRETRHARQESFRRLTEQTQRRKQEFERELRQKERRALAESMQNQPVKGDLADILWRAGPGEAPVNIGPFSFNIRHLPSDRNTERPAYDGDAAAKWRGIADQLIGGRDPAQREPLIPRKTQSLPEQREAMYNTLLRDIQTNRAALREAAGANTNTRADEVRAATQEAAVGEEEASQEYDTLANLIRQFQERVGNQQMTLGNIQ